MAVLAGERPDQFLPRLLLHEPRTFQPARVDVGLPSDLLQRRPDIVAAERNLAAATARIGVARANLFPSISLTGNAGTLAAQAGDLFDQQARAAGIGAFINLPVFDGGARRAAVSEAEAAAQAAFAAYRGAVLTAFADVEEAMAAYAFGQDRIAALSEALDDRERALALAASRYEAGFDDLFALLDAQRARLAAEADLATARTDVLIAYVALFRALGGGWPGELTE
jgi:NodT family efflux transporter outer membrane factor (OMF) lipoprotein